MDKPDPVLKHFAANVKSLRESKGIAQEKFAIEAGVDRRGFARIEKGDVDVRLTTIAKIAAALEVPIGALFELKTSARKTTKSRVRRTDD
jgi:transcriptional regulator with XRE-family HTH domain